MSLRVSIHCGASGPTGMKMPERNSRGRIVAFTIGGAASAFGIAGVSASPSAAKLAAPTRTTTIDRTRSMPVGRSAS